MYLYCFTCIVEIACNKLVSFLCVQRTLRLDLGSEVNSMYLEVQLCSVRLALFRQLM